MKGLVLVMENKKKFKISYNSPVVLTFALISLTKYSKNSSTSLGGR